MPDTSGMTPTLQNATAPETNPHHAAALDAHMSHPTHNSVPASLTKILATLGPATDDEHALRRLVENGARAFRLNFSHGQFSAHLMRLHAIRKLSQETDLPLAVVGDLQGPKIRVGDLPHEGIEIHAGADIIFRCEDGPQSPDAQTLPCTYERLADEVQPGHRVLINDGAIRTLAVGAEDLGGGARGLRCRVTVGGLVTSGKGVNLPDSDISAPAITEQDWTCVNWAVEHGIDYLALSFVRTAEDVQRLQLRLTEMTGADESTHDRTNTAAAKIPVIAKIEKPQAVQNIDEILQEADLLMVARGDLGVEMDLALVPIKQKHLIRRAHAYGKPVIVATQMLESMIDTPTPTRAEVSDVANAIYDGADIVMLSGETAIGKHGDLAVDTMRRIAIETERSILESHLRQPRVSTKLVESRNRLSALAHGAWDIVHDAGARIVAVWSESGDAAQLLSQIGLRIPILAFTTEARVAQRMALFSGVTPILRESAPEHRSDFDVLVDRRILDDGLAAEGERVVVLAGKPLGRAGVVNTVSLHTIGEALDTGSD